MQGWFRQPMGHFTGQPSLAALAKPARMAVARSSACPWALFRGLPHWCYDENPLKTLPQVWNRYSLVINTEQFFGLTEAYALLSRSKGGRLVSFETNRGSRSEEHTSE